MAEAEGNYAKLARWVMHHRGLTVMMVAAVTILSAVLGLPPKVDSNLLNLLPENDPTIAMLRRVNEEEGGLNTLTLTAYDPDPEVLEAFLTEAEQKFLELDEVEWAAHRFDDTLATQIGLMQLDSDELGELIGRLEGALALGPAAANPLVTQQLMDMGPLTERIADLSSRDLFDAGDGMRRLVVRPEGSAHDPKYSRDFMKQAYGVLHPLYEKYPTVEEVWLGGPYRHTDEDVRGIQQDLLWTSLVSAGLVLLVIIVAFRDWKSTLLVFTPLVVANIITLSMSSFMMGALNTYTSFGTAILLGLGIDFAVHLVGRYREYRRDDGMEVEDAVAKAWDVVGAPCTTAALTSAAGFLALATAEFRGFAQLGVLLAGGLLLCLIMMLVLLPVLIPVLDHTPKLLLGHHQGERQPSTSSYHAAPTGLMLAVLITGVVGAIAIPNLEFEWDVSSLRREGLAADELDSRQLELSKSAYSPVLVELDSRADLAPLENRVEKLIELGKLPHVSNVLSIDNVLPEHQEAQVMRLNQLSGLLDNANLRYLPMPLVKRLLPLRGKEFEVLLASDLPPALASLTGAEEGSRTRMLIVPQGNMWDAREQIELSDELRPVLKNYEYAGEYIATAKMYGLAFGDLTRVGILAFALVTLLAAIDLRKPLWTVSAIGTLLAGMVWAGATLYANGIKLTLINIAGIPILLGIGVDVVIHLLHRLKEEGPGGVRHALRTTGVAAIISTLTTIASFFSLTFAGNRGVQSLGLLVVIGLATVTLATGAMLPLMWAAGWKMSGQAPSDQDS